jgi:predicted ATPase with chaperone activity
MTMGTTPYAEPIAKTIRLVGHQPQTVEETGVPINLLENLALKLLYLASELSPQELGRRMQLHPGVINEIVAHLRKGQLIDVVVGTFGSDLRILTTSKGQTEAHRIMSRDMYSGPAPVSLSAYVEVIRSQSVLDVVIHRPDLRKSFENLVVSDSMLDQLGAALVSGQSIILYGPTGTGKTVIAETLPRIYRDWVWIPYAVEVQGQIITVFNPPAHGSPEEIMPAGCDGRWVLCPRPRVMAGGELTMDMLDLRLNPSSGFYTAPLQMMANNGFLVLDDLGRQRISPTELLNRWIVPLDRRIDYLTLAGGHKFEIPFDLIIVFSTNLDPVSLADEAFLRRIQTKIKVTYVTDEQFHEIARLVCTQSGLEYDAAVVDELTKVIAELGQPLRACYPRDIIQHICWKAKYDGKQPLLTLDAIREACNRYFLGPNPHVESV